MSTKNSNPHTLKIVYKLVNILPVNAGKKEQLISSNVGPSIRIDYSKKNQWISPKIKGSKLFVFGSLEGVAAFLNCKNTIEDIKAAVGKSSKLLVCIGENASPVFNRLTISGASIKNIQLYWAGKYNNLSNMPSFTGNCDVFGVSRLKVIEEFDFENPATYSLGYKQVKMVPTDNGGTTYHSTSHTNSLAALSIQYVPNRWTSPVISNSKLFVFNDISALQKFISFGTVSFLAVLKNPQKVPKPVRVYGDSNKIVDMSRWFWNNVGVRQCDKSSKIYTDAFRKFNGDFITTSPIGTVFCDSVYLLRKI